jgi:diguanylate cyclase (GGDEF)-like protein
MFRNNIMEKQTRNILFVDDEPQFLSGVKRMLRRKTRQWEISSAESMGKAIEILKEKAFDTIVCDVKMPDDSGFKLLQWLRENKETQNLPVIMLTGAFDEDLKLKALDMGAADLLNKPVSHGDLIARINSCLRLKSYHDRIIRQNLFLEEEVKKRTWQALLEAEVNTAFVQDRSYQFQLKYCVKAIVKYLDAAFARIWVYDEKKELLELIASAGMYTHIDGNHQYIPIGTLKIGKIAQEKTPLLTNSVIGDPHINDQEWAKKEGIIAFAGYPLIVRDRLVGVMAMFSKKRLDDSIFDSLSSISNKLALSLKEKKSEDDLHILAFYDSLTTLPNRSFFFEFIQKTIESSQRYQEKFAVAMIDIDNFSRINKSLGDIVGDECLKTISDRLLKILRKSDLIARGSDQSHQVIRMGGDHFMAFMHNTPNPEIVGRIANRILEGLSQTYRIDGHELFLTASIGVVMYPEDGNDGRILLKNAEAALDHVKKTGKNRFGFYSSDMNDRSAKTLQMEAQIKNAIDLHEFTVFYQPQMEIIGSKVIGMEALVRWQKNNGGLVQPNDFIPLAEENGLIVPIGSFVLEAACIQNKRWMDAGTKPVRMAVNVSAQQFGRDDFVETVLFVLQKTGLPPRYLELEITETTIMADPDRAIQNLNKLKDNNIKISLDDFGTGYSSLAYLRDLPIDTVKIDISFIRNLLSNPNDAAIVKTIIDMAGNLKLRTIAEGVENQAQLYFLKKQGCDIIQGYLISPPVPATDFQRFLALD